MVSHFAASFAATFISSPFLCYFNEADDPLDDCTNLLKNNFEWEKLRFKSAHITGLLFFMLLRDGLSYSFLMRIVIG